MKKAILFVVFVSVVFLMSSCILISPTPIGSKWLGTAAINWLDSNRTVPDGGTYSIDITLNFDWLLDSTKIVGGTVILTPIVIDDSRIVIQPYTYTISSGQYTAANTLLEFTCTTDSLGFSGYVTNKAVTNGVINQGTLLLGSFNISQQ
jgi:hypothetical protein